MRRSVIVATSIISIVLCLCMLTYSVFANINQSFSVSNTIGFVSSEDIYVGLDCEVSGCEQAQLTTPPTGYSSLEEYRSSVGLVNKLTFDESQRGSKQVIGDWSISESLKFVVYQTPIVYTIKIYNYSDQAIRVSFSDYVTDESIIVNTVSESVTIDAYEVRNGNPSFATITMTTRVALGSASFNQEPNNFVVVIENS